MSYEKRSAATTTTANHNKHNKDAIYNVTKAVAAKSILTQITRATAENGYLWTKTQGSRISVNIYYYNTLNIRISSGNPAANKGKSVHV